MAISGMVVVTSFVAVLLAGLPSFVALVTPVTVARPAVVGVPDTAHDTVWLTGTLAPAVHALLDGLMVQAPTVTPAGKPVTPHAVPAVASALPVLVQLKVPV